MRITVAVPDLINRLQEYKRRELAAHHERAEHYPDELNRYKARVVAALERELVSLRKGRRLPCPYAQSYGSTRTGAVIVRVGAMPPTKPQRPNFTNVNRRIKELRLSTKPELSIDTAGKDWRGLFHAIEERGRA